MTSPCVGRAACRDGAGGRVGRICLARGARPPRALGLAPYVFSVPDYSPSPPAEGGEGLGEEGFLLAGGPVCQQ